MTLRPAHPPPAKGRRDSRAGALALAVLLLLSACATRAPMGRNITSLEDFPKAQRLFTRLPTGFAPVQVGEVEFANVLTTLLLEMPLRVACSNSPSDVRRELVLASIHPTGSAWHSDLAMSYGRYCERRGTPGDCLTLFDDGPHLQAEDKRRIALALAVGPALEGLDAEVRAMLDPARLLPILSITIAAYMALLLVPVPEPVTKSLAAAFTVLMWGYLGWEFFDLLRAYARLHEDAPSATTFAQLREVGESFGRVIGPNSVRILVMVATAATGESVALASKAPKLPGFAQASRTAEGNTGLRLMEAATGAERVIVSVPEGTLHVVLSPHVMAMAGRSVAAGSSAPGRGKLLANGHRAWGSFSGFKSALGPAGKGKVWHHIVEQTPGNAKRFGGEALHNTGNVTAVEEALHTRLSAFYSSIRPKITNSNTLTVRQWLSTQSYEAQREFGLLALKNIAGGIW